MDDRQFEQTATEPFRSSLTALEVNICDLPREVLEIIFENIDSVNRKKIERVCKGWMQIIRGARKFRTHLKVELPPLVFPYHYSSFREKDLILKLGHLVTPDLEVLHFKPSKIPDVNLDSADFYHNIADNSFQSFLGAFERAGVDLSKVDIIISDCTVDCAFLSDFRIAEDTRKIRILRSNILAVDLFARSTLYVEELWWENLDQVNAQMWKLFLAENGPLTRKHSAILRRLRRHLIINGVPHIEEIHLLADHLEGWGYDKGYDWIELLTTIANGGHVSGHMVGFLVTRGLL